MRTRTRPTAEPGTTSPHDRSDPGPRVSRSRWAALGAAVAVAVGAGGVGLVEATVSEGERPVLVRIDPCRLADTRAGSGIGPRQTPIGAGETVDVAAVGANGNCSIPAGAVGLSLNVTALGATERTNVRVFPDGAATPLTSNLNPFPGAPPAPNAVTTDLGPTGAFSVFNEFGAVDVVIDVNGYYEDHDHDDRYVQHDQVMWAVVRSNGTLARASEGVVSSALLDGVVPAGDYRVTFDRDVSECAYQVTSGSTTSSVGPPPGYAVVAGWSGDPTSSVAVFQKGADGSGVENRAFHLTVTC